MVDKQCFLCNKDISVRNKDMKEKNFCSRTCRAIYFNKNRGVRSEETREKIATSVSKYCETQPQIIFLDNAICVQCGKEFTYKSCPWNPRKACSKKCAGKISSLSENSQSRRSKNEVCFAEHCIDYFGIDNVLCNEKMFDGWDADVIIPIISTCISWNGKWHYEKIKEGQSLLQIQTRDRIKNSIITKKYGWDHYIIKDMGSYNPKFVEEQFQIFIKWLEEPEIEFVD